MTLRGGFGLEANFCMNFGPSLNCFMMWMVQSTRFGYKLLNSIVVEARSWHACITWFHANKVHNIQLNKGLPQKCDARDIFVN